MMMFWKYKSDHLSLLCKQLLILHIKLRGKKLDALPASGSLFYFDPCVIHLFLLLKVLRGPSDHPLVTKPTLLPSFPSLANIFVSFNFFLKCSIPRTAFWSPRKGMTHVAHRCADLFSARSCCLKFPTVHLLIIFLSSFLTYSPVPRWWVPKDKNLVHHSAPFLCLEWCAIHTSWQSTWSLDP